MSPISFSYILINDKIMLKYILYMSVTFYKHSNFMANPD